MWRWACALALLCSLSLARSGNFKRVEMATLPFVLSSRYGRSLPRTISQRNDRFIMTTRYGKRSESPSNMEPSTSDILPSVTWRVLCEMQAFTSLCNRQHLPPKPFHNRINNEGAIKKFYF